jgi:hypothetical protein
VQKCSQSNTKQAEKNICTELLQQREKDRDALLSRIVTNDETRVHHYDPLTKRQQNDITSCHARIKFNVQTSADKVMVSIFWDRSCYWNSSRKLSQSI